MPAVAATSSAGFSSAQLPQWMSVLDGLVETDTQPGLTVYEIARARRLLALQRADALCLVYGHRASAVLAVRQELQEGRPEQLLPPPCQSVEWVHDLVQLQQLGGQPGLSLDEVATARRALRSFPNPFNIVRVPREIAILAVRLLLRKGTSTFRVAPVNAATNMAANAETRAGPPAYDMSAGSIQGVHTPSCCSPQRHRASDVGSSTSGISLPATAVLTLKLKEACVPHGRMPEFAVGRLKSITGPTDSSGEALVGAAAGLAMQASTHGRLRGSQQTDGSGSTYSVDMQLDDVQLYQKDSTYCEEDHAVPTLGQDYMDACMQSFLEVRNLSIQRYMSAHTEHEK